jgi:glutaredoxin
MSNSQHYPPGTQENYNSFYSRNLIMGKGKELEFPEGRGGGKGEPPVPPSNSNSQPPTPSTETNQYTIYTKQGCSFCDKVKELLREQEREPFYIDSTEYISDESSKTLFLNFIQRAAQIEEPYKTFPMVFYEGKFIGGFSQTKLFLEKQSSFSLTEDF